MKALLKHTLRSLGKNKIQAAVIILTLIIITVMIFSAFSMSDVFYTINMSEHDRVAQGADMLLGANFGDSELFSRTRVELLLSDKNDIASVEYFIKMGTIMKTKDISRTVLVEATDLYTYLDTHKLNYVERYEGEYRPNKPNADITLEYQPVIIGERFAIESGISVGDTVEIYLASLESYAKLSVAYIAENSGIFGAASGINILMDFSSIGNFGQVNAVYINFTDDSLFEKYENIFKEHLPSISCTEGNNKTEVLAIVKNNSILLTVGLLFIIATMILIQMTSYLIIARNRMAEMVIFKASGATPVQAGAIMLLEVLMYAIIGVSIGLACGRMVMEIAVIKLIPAAHSVITYNFWKYLSSILIGFMVTVIAALVPIVNASKRSIRDLTSSGSKDARAERGWLFIIFSALLVICALLLKFLSGIGVIFISAILVIIVAVWISLAITYVVKFASFVMSKIKNGGGFGLSSITVKRNRAMHTITVLFAIVIVFSFMIVEVVSMVKLAITPFRMRYDSDFVVVAGDSLSLLEHNKLKLEIENIDGIADVGFFNSINFLLPNEEKDSFSIYGMFDWWTLTQSTIGLDAKVEKDWSATSNPLVLSQDMMIRLDKNIGDTIVLKTVSQDFRDMDFEFTIIGIDYTTTEYDRVGYTKFSILSHMDKSATHIVVADNNLSSAEKKQTFLALRDMVENFKPSENVALKKSYALTYEDWAYSGRSSVAGIVSLLTLFQYAIFIISLLGLINIAIVTLYDRRHELILYRLSGMSDYMSFSLGESIVMAVSGGIIGIVTGTAINQLLPVMSILVDKYMDFGVFPLKILLVALIGAILFVAMWLLIAFMGRKNNITAINERLN